MSDDDEIIEEEEVLRPARVDMRRASCRKWTVIDDKRTPCGKPRWHQDPCSWETVLMTDDSPWGDAGPYEDGPQAVRDFTRWAAQDERQPRFAEKAVSQAQAARLKVLEAAMLAGIVPTAFEQEYLQKALADPILATILHGWLLRGAHPYLLRKSGALNETVEKDTEAN